jgi:flagellar basal-body rod protein FlgC
MPNIVPMAVAHLVPRPLRQLFRPLAISEAGMSEQQSFMETIAANIANAETTRTADGTAYHRRIAVTRGNAVQVMEDRSDGRMVYDPGHPDADANGYVKMPNVDIAQETVDIMIARRMHAANATAFQAAKAMLRSALNI